MKIPRTKAIKMKLFLALTLLAGVLTHPDHGEFKKWAKNKAMESCWGEENMKIWTVRMKKAVAKCSQQDAPELLLPHFRAPYKTVNALLEGQEEGGASCCEHLATAFFTLTMGSSRSGPRTRP